MQILAKQDKIIIEGVGTFPAAALRFEYLGDGRFSIYDTWLKRYQLWNARAETIIDEGGRPLIGAAQSVEQAFSEKVMGQIVEVASYSYLWAEEDGDIRGGVEWSMGANSSDANLWIPLLRPGQIVSLGIDTVTPPAHNSLIVGVVIGQSLTNYRSMASITLEKGKDSAWLTLPAPADFRAGDKMGVVTLVGDNSAKRGRVIILLKH